MKEVADQEVRQKAPVQLQATFCIMAECRQKEGQTGDREEEAWISAQE